MLTLGKISIVCCATSGVKLAHAQGALQSENSAEHPVGHGEVHPQARQKGQGSARLRQSENVGNGVSDSAAGKDTEVKQSGGQLSSGQCVKEANHHEGNHVLKVI